MGRQGSLDGAMCRMLLISKCSGIKHTKQQQQDEQMDPNDHHIRRVIGIAADSMEGHESDDPPTGKANTVRIMICMSKEGSERLINAQYPQSDIAFKRVAGYYEFELASVDRDANTSRLTHQVPFSSESY